MVEHIGILEEAENLVKIGHFEEAFDKFMALESGVYDANFLRPCQMALANQLGLPQLKELSVALDKEVSRDNSYATFNYGCIKAHLKEIGLARVLLMRASQMGIAAAAEVLRKIWFLIDLWYCETFDSDLIKPYSIMSSSISDFHHTTFLRIKAVMGLVIANVFLIHDEWTMFFFVLFLAIICEILHRKLSEVILHNRRVNEHNRKNWKKKDSRKPQQ